MNEKASVLSSSSNNRLYYLDWLRVLAMIGVFFFHNARFFDVWSDWHVKNATTNLGASIVTAFLGQWMMPLFFLIAGASTYYAMESRKVGKYALDRTLRIFIPFIFGMLVIVVPQAYFQALSHGEQLGGYNFFQIYGLYLQTLPDLEWFHLWFLVYLFVFSLITIPIFLNFGNSGKSLIFRVAAAFSQPWALILLFVVTIGIVDIFLYPGGFLGNRNGGFNIVIFLLFFIFGYLIFANPRIMEGIRKFAWITLGIGIIALLSAVALFTNELADPAKYFGSTSFIISQFAQALSTSCWVLAVLGLGSRFLNSSNKFLTYGNEAVLPFYILHQSVIISIGFFVVQWDTNIGLKYLTISSTSFIAIMLIYEFLVRRINVLRFLFGMRWIRKQRTATTIEKL